MGKASDRFQEWVRQLVAEAGDRGESRASVARKLEISPTYAAKIVKSEAGEVQTRVIERAAANFDLSPRFFDLSDALVSTWKEHVGHDLPEEPDPTGNLYSHRVSLAAASLQLKLEAGEMPTAEEFAAIATMIVKSPPVAKALAFTDELAGQARRDRLTALGVALVIQLVSEPSEVA